MTPEQLDAEREAFELDYAKGWQEASPNAKRHSIEYLCSELKEMRNGEKYGETQDYLNFKWEGWRAKAEALGSQQGLTSWNRAVQKAAEVVGWYDPSIDNPLGKYFERNAVYEQIMRLKTYKEHKTEDLSETDPLWLVNQQILGLMENDGAPEDHEDVINFLSATGLPAETVKAVHAALVNTKAKTKAAQKQPWPNHNWCVGCTPDDCSGCGTEPNERRKGVAK